MKTIRPLTPEVIAARIDLRVAQLRVLAAATAVACARELLSQRLKALGIPERAERARADRAAPIAAGQEQADVKAPGDKASHESTHAQAELLSPALGASDEQRALIDASFR